MDKLNKESKPGSPVVVMQGSCQHLRGACSGAIQQHHNWLVSETAWQAGENLFAQGAHLQQAAASGTLQRPAGPQLWQNTLIESRSSTS